MLLLPLLIWWAHRPMHFSGNLLGTINTLLTFAAVVIPLWGDRSVHAADRTGGAHHELRSDSSLVSTPGGVGELRMRGKRFREGTLVPPTTGHFAPSGRRWVFIPDDATADKDTVADTRLTPSPARTLVAIPINPLRISTPPISFTTWRDEPFPGDMRSHDPNTPPFRLAANAQSSGLPNDQVNPIGIPQLIAVENLMLQRIVEAIRVDGSDNRWTITAQITEYFEENRLQILTAERAPAK